MTATELKLGFGMQGMGPLITPYLDQVCQNFESVTYLEIGVGHGETLTAIADYLRHENDLRWRAIGVELPDGYSFSQEATSQNAYGKHLSIRFENRPARSWRINPPWRAVTVYLDNSQLFLADRWSQEIQLALIDGCHGKKCASMDFLLLEPFIIRGGFVLMHDFGEDQVGQKQPHCPEGLDVRGAARELGLMDNARAGWDFVDELVGDKHAGSGDMGVFQRL
jgi:hypothetical protein